MSGEPERPNAAVRLSRLWTDERARGILWQVLLLLGLALLIAGVVFNTVTNLQRAGLASGFGFLFDTASFDINQRLIHYQSTSTYGRAFLVGGLNTIVVAVLGIAAATVIGFLAGVARLSRNFLVSRMVGAYVEFTRNVPLLLQIIFWWVVILALPRVRNSIAIADTVYLNNRGVRMPWPVFGDGVMLVLAALAAAAVAAFAVARWARARQERTGQTFPSGWCGLGLIAGATLVAWFAVGQPVTFDEPAMGRFNLRGGFNVTPELVALWAGALHLHRRVHCRDRARRHPLGGARTGGGRGRAGSAPRAHHAKDHPASGIARDRAAAHQPVPEPHQELVAGGRHRVPGHRFHR